MAAIPSSEELPGRDHEGSIEHNLGVFSFHLVETSPLTVARACTRPPARVGLRHAECMLTMRLGYPIAHPRRYQLNTLAMFARWDDEAALDRFLQSQSLGVELARGWHVRMAFIRRWGLISEFDGLPIRAEKRDPELPVVALTLARLKLTESPRFIHWGKPVERLVRDHPGKTLALAAARPNHTLSTFSIWHSSAEMTNMVRGRSDGPDGTSHDAAMGERDRKDFHHEFTTLRFRPISEHGSWQGRTEYVPVKR